MGLDGTEAPGGGRRWDSEVPGEGGEYGIERCLEEEGRLDREVPGGEQGPRGKGAKKDSLPHLGGDWLGFISSLTNFRRWFAKEDYTVHVAIKDYLDIYCPHYDPRVPTEQTENFVLYIVDHEGYDGCYVTAEAYKRWKCNQPHAPAGPIKFSEKIQRFTPISLGVEFHEGQDYYYISIPDVGSVGECLKIKLSVCCQSTTRAITEVPKSQPRGREHGGGGSSPSKDGPGPSSLPPGQHILGPSACSTHSSCRRISGLTSVVPDPGPRCSKLPAALQNCPFWTKDTAKLNGGRQTRGGPPIMKWTEPIVPALTGGPALGYTTPPHWGAPVFCEDRFQFFPFTFHDFYKNDIAQEQAGKLGGKRTKEKKAQGKVGWRVGKRWRAGKLGEERMK
ncbi:unnamed protein product [Ranitomeya imitator]|uniref:Ephrin RBD domain-containing protein n=1 Tax=Ranitomeya imitator TaxID=111125 RepID=A0ABN9LXN9_9NEOB|nr:unnamed protein product [Ranitomeya imitator]